MHIINRNNLFSMKEQTSNKEVSGVKKLIKKVLTNKAMRNATAMSAFVVTVADVGVPWTG